MSGGILDSIALGTRSEVEPCCVCRVLIYFSVFPLISPNICELLSFFLFFFLKLCSAIIFGYFQEEYNDGEDIRTLECGDEFHSEGIK